MTEKSHFRGHPIEYNGTRWVYSDDKTPTVTGWKERPCGHCGKHFTPEGARWMPGYAAGDYERLLRSRSYQ